jgi:hypothetical protein
MRVLQGQFRELPPCPRALPGTESPSQGEPCRYLAYRGDFLKTKAVPSDPRTSLLPSRHARPERGFGSPVRFSLRSPPQLLAVADQRSGRRTALRSRRSRRLGAAFHSPAAVAPFEASSAGSSFPAYPFAASRLGTRTRSALDSPPRRAAAGRGGSTSKARCSSRQAVIPLPPQTLLPLGISRSLGFNARPDSAPGSSPGQHRLPSSLPRSACLAVGVSGSSLRGSQAASGSLFRGPLGTTPILQRTDQPCQAHPSGKSAQFREKYLLVFQSVTKRNLLKFFE